MRPRSAYGDFDLSGKYLESLTLVKKARKTVRCFCLLTVGLLALCAEKAAAPAPAPGTETLRYRIEWRLIPAGTAKLDFSRHADGVESKLQILSTGLVSAFFRVDDRYTSKLDSELCAVSSYLISEEGSRKRETKVAYDRDAHMAHYKERDLVKDSVVLDKETETPPCVLDIIGGLYRLRQIEIPVGKSAEAAISDGKKSVMARIDSQIKESVKTPAGTFSTVRYEVFVFNDVLFKRSGRLLVWFTDDEKRIPVQVQVRLQFHIGTLTAQLEKYES
jgi:hypothetical protein